ncbi:FAD-dependent monooxygenase [Flammeovirgaceae bacterium SG7u.111]|nr:FAD-dependent monooxygenase [Flammeovirgaceae bacterium SG7u.132]WPO35639.1 FAD-dependent monooxygenase [Flammeovirgaceae bacterium SG7u.111]
MEVTDFDVGIIGYGPVGMTAACLLAKQGHSVVVIEKRKELLQLPRAIHFDAETLRIWQKLGLHTALLKNTMPTEGLKIEDKHGRLLLQGVNKTDCGFPPNLMFYQPDLENLLDEKVKSFAEIELRKGCGYVSHWQGDEWVRLYVKSNNKEEQLKVKYLLGCDGANSSVRKEEGFGLKKLPYSGHSLKIDLFLKEEEKQRKADFPKAVVKTANPAGPKVFIPGFGRHLRWEFIISKKRLKQKSEGYFLENKTVFEKLSPFIAPTLIELKHVAIYHFRSAVAKKWWENRVMIAGDAAHQMPPFIGQGMCSGIRDVDNLIWKTSFLLKKQSFKDLLTSYQHERYPHVNKLIWLTILTGLLFSSPLAFVLFLLSEIPLVSGFLKKLLFPEEKLTAGLLGKHKLRGRLFPQVNGSDELLGDDFALISLGKISEDERRVLKTSFPLKFVVAPEGEIAAWMRRYEIEVVIVRPDRYIFDAGNRQELRQLFNRLTLLV